MSRFGKVNYSFDSVFLDPQYSDTFIELCKRENIITKDIDGYKVNPERKPLTGKFNLLRALVLFDKVDFSSSIYDCEELIEKGIVSEHGICCSNENTDENYEKAAVPIMEAYKAGIIKYLRDEYKKSLKLRNFSDGEKIVYNEDDFNRIVLTRDYSCDLTEDFDAIVRNLDVLYAPANENTAMFIHNALYTDHISSLLGIRNNLAYALQSSEKNRSVYMGSFLNEGHGSKLYDPAENVYAFVKTKLPDEVKYLPMPQTFEDVLKMRKDPSIKAFRNVMKEFDYYINNDDITAAEKIKKDIIKANHYFESLDKVKSFSSSQIVRTACFGLSWIPIISNVVSIVSFVGPIVLDSLEAKYSWTHINESCR